jgi:transitional endoplasmic reticulum ATPase
MNINKLKDECNALFDRAIGKLEKYADPNEICKLLLDAASLLVEIGKNSPPDKPKCDSKAKMLLTVSKKLRVNGLHSIAYYDLTGRVLNTPKPEEKLNTEAIKDILNQKKITPSANEAVPSDYQFEWDKLPSISFDDVAGLEDVKDAVVRKVLLPLANPELYEGYVKKNGGGLLLYGPPGTGKTMIAAAIAHEIGAKFCSIGASDLVLGGIGNSEKAITKLFQEARSFKCAVIFFDEIESICPASTRAQHAKQIRSELLRQIQGLDAYGKESDKILFLIAATNKPWDIDPAFVRPGRFGTRIYVGLPDEPARKYMIESRLNKIKASGIVTIADDVNIDAIVAATENFNGADMGNLLDEVQEVSIMRSATGEAKVINQSDFKNVLSRITSSVQKKDLEKLEGWKNENG